jgi:hypothetical protein
MGAISQPPDLTISTIYPNLRGKTKYNPTAYKFLGQSGFMPESATIFSLLAQNPDATALAHARANGP